MVWSNRERPLNESVVIKREQKGGAPIAPKHAQQVAKAHDPGIRAALFALGRALLDVRGMAIELRQHTRLPKDAAGQFERDLTAAFLGSMNSFGLLAVRNWRRLGLRRTRTKRCEDADSCAAGQPTGGAQPGD